MTRFFFFFIFLTTSKKKCDDDADDHNASSIVHPRKFIVAIIYGHDMITDTRTQKSIYRKISSVTFQTALRMSGRYRLEPLWQSL